MADLEKGLLGKQDLALEKGSEWGAIFNFCCITCGAGVLSLPHAVFKVGVIPAVLMIVICAWLFSYYYRIMVKCFEQTGESTYGLMVNQILGSFWMHFVEINIVLFLYGVVCAFHALFSKLMWEVVESVYLGSEINSMHVHLSIVLFVASPLCLLKSMTSLRYFSLISVIGILSISLTIFFQMPMYYYNSTSKVELYKFSWDIVESFSIIMFSYDAIAAIPSIYSELQSREKMDEVITIGLTITAVFYCVLGVFGYLSLGDSLETISLITSRPYYWGTDYFMLLAKLIIGSTFVVILVIAIHLLRVNIQRLCSTRYDYITWYVVTYISLWSSALVAIQVPEAITYFKILGGFGVVQIVVFVPYLLYLYTNHTTSGKIGMTLITIPLISIGIAAAIKSIWNY